MMGLFDDLARRALGEEPAGAARVALPPRFASRGEGAEWAEAPTAMVTQAPSEAGVRVYDAVTSHTHVTHVGALEELGEAAVQEARAAPTAAPVEPVIAAASAKTPPEASQPATKAHAPEVQPVVTAALKQPPPAPLPLAQERAAPVRSDVPPTSAPAVAPLSPAACAARVSMPAPQPAPTIHVEIDRIDVRAPVAQPDTPPARRTRTAAVSLADYLGGRR